MMFGMFKRGPRQVESVVLLAAAGLAASAIAGPPQPRLEILATTHDFGEVWMPEQLEHTFQLRNTGDAPLLIEDVKAKCGCTVKGRYDHEIPPGGAGTIPLVLHARNLEEFKKEVTVHTNDPDHSTVTLALKGVVRRHVTVRPRTIRFTNVRADQTLRQAVKITTADADTRLELSNDETPDALATSLVRDPVTNTYELAVEARPPFAEGTTRATVNLTSNVAEQPVVEVPVIVHVPPRLRIVPSRIVVPPAGEASQRTARLTVTNNGTEPVEVLSATGGAPGVTAEVEVLNPGRRYRIAIRFDEDYRPSKRGDHVTLTLQDGSQRQETVPIVGR